MKKYYRSIGLTTFFLSAIVAGCGGSNNSTGGVTGQIRGTVTRVIIPGVPNVEPIRTASNDTAVEVFQGDVRKSVSRTNALGEFTIALPPGRYRVKPSEAILERTPGSVSSSDVDVLAGQTAPVALEITIPAP